MNEIVTAAAAGVVVIDHDGDDVVVGVASDDIDGVAVAAAVEGYFCFSLKSQFKALALIKFQLG